LYRLTLLGGVLLSGPDGPVGGRASQQRRLALLAYLGSAGDKGRSRDSLIALL
jgi:DNA-binding SARP family transcriptional activator